MAYITDEDFEDEFSMFDHSTNGDSEVTDKLRDLCTLHNLDAGGIVLEWVAFVQSKKSKVAIKMNMEGLEMLERERLSKLSSKPNKTPAKSKTTIYNITNLQDAVDGDTADALLGAYSTPNSKAAKKRQHTPETVQNKRLTTLGRSPAVAPFSPTSFSPASSTPSQKYGSRKNAGEVICSFGASAKATWTSSRDEPCSVKPYDPTMSLTDKFKYMFQKMADKAHVLNDMIEDIGDTLKSHYNIDALSHLALPAQEQVTVCGRVCCDSNGKLNAQSVVLDGSRESSAGKHIPVDLSAVSKYSLFPGQVVVVEGINNTGNKLVAQKVYQNVPLPLASCDNVLPSGPLNVVVAAGPFTTSDSTSYDPLKDLVTCLNKSSPDICFMLGPFLDAKHPEIEKGFGDMTYQQHFNSKVHQILQETSRTQVVLVPSQRDVHSEYVYPQPPYRLDKHKRLHCVSDPCTLNVDGVVFGITSTDILFHLGAEEISCNPAGPSDRLARLTKHILTQQSFYPLYPAQEDVNIDYEQAEQYARLPVTPHVMIVPSELRYFVKDIDGCCCVNPGRLAKGQVGGTYCRLQISSPGGTTVKSMASHVAAEIVRI